MEKAPALRRLAWLDHDLAIACRGDRSGQGLDALVEPKRREIDRRPASRNFRRCVCSECSAGSQGSRSTGMIGRL